MEDEKKEAVQGDPMGEKILEDFIRERGPEAAATARIDTRNMDEDALSLRNELHAVMQKHGVIHYNVIASKHEDSSDGPVMHFCVGVVNSVAWMTAFSIANQTDRFLQAFTSILSGMRMAKMLMNGEIDAKAVLNKLKGGETKTEAPIITPGGPGVVIGGYGG